MYLRFEPARSALTGATVTGPSNMQGKTMLPPRPPSFCASSLRMFPRDRAVRRRPREQGGPNHPAGPARAFAGGALARGRGRRPSRPRGSARGRSRRRSRDAWIPGEGRLVLSTPLGTGPRVVRPGPETRLGQRSPKGPAGHSSAARWPEWFVRGDA